MAERIVAAACLVALCGCAGRDKSPAGATDEVVVHLDTDRRVWSRGEAPSFRATVRNNGKRELRTCPIASLALQLDGKPCVPASWFPPGEMAIKPFGPGVEHTALLSLGDYGVEDLGLGNHTIRVAYVVMDDGNAIGASLDRCALTILGVSNAVEIEIVADLATQRTAPNETSGGDVQ